MRNVTQANASILVNLAADTSRETLEFFSLEPAAPLRVTLRRGAVLLFNETVTADPKNGNRISAAVPSGSSGDVTLTIATADGRELIAAAAAIN
jgi:hypothetical protein